MAENGILLLAKRAMPSRAADDPDALLLHVQTLAVTGGLERTQAEYRALLAEAGSG
jgi:hypothetical protein